MEAIRGMVVGEPDLGLVAVSGGDGASSGGIEIRKGGLDDGIHGFSWSGGQWGV